jgi:Phosphotransferase enzyme family
VAVTADSAGPTPAVVAGVEHLTPDWLAAALAPTCGPAEIRSLRTEPVGTGQMATTVRVFLETDSGDRTLIAKVARDDVGPEMARMAYLKEVSFYAELRDRVAMRIPGCLYAAVEPESVRFVLLLEDMVGAVPGDQIAGCTPEHAEAAVINLAGLHGPTWCDDTLRSAPWLWGDPKGSSQILAPFLAIAADCFEARFAAELTEDEIAVLASSRELLVPWLLARGERFAVTHGDYRLDNLLFPEADPRGVAAVDWQTVGLGPPGRDLAYFLATSLSPEDRRRHEEALLVTYQQALADHGVTGYTREECWEDYRLGMLHGPLIIFLGRLTATVTDRGDEMFKVMWQRCARAILDLGSLDAVRASIDRP